MTYFIIFQFQIEHQAHGAKSNDPVMNCDNDDQLILKPGQKLSESNVRHETEIAFFKLSDYQAYLKLKESAEKQWILTRKKLKNSKKTQKMELLTVALVIILTFCLIFYGLIANAKRKEIKTAKRVLLVIR